MEGGLGIPLCALLQVSVRCFFPVDSMMRGMRRVFATSGRSYSEQSSWTGAGGFNLFGRLSSENPLVGLTARTTVSRILFAVGVGVGMFAAGEYLWGKGTKHRNMMTVFEKGRHDSV